MKSRSILKGIKGLLGDNILNLGSVMIDAALYGAAEAFMSLREENEDPVIMAEIYEILLNYFQMKEEYKMCHSLKSFYDGAQIRRA